MRSSTLTVVAGLERNFARQHTGYRLAARRGAGASRRLRSGQHVAACSAMSAVGSRSAGQAITRRAARADQTACTASEAIGRRVLVAIRVAMGLMFVACGLSGFIDLNPAHAGSMQGGAMAFGGALLVAGSALPLLKGTEVIVETILELQRALSSRRLDR